MLFVRFIYILFAYVIALLGMAFFTLLERKALGYFQLRKGPNKVGIVGLPQPLGDAFKLFSKELAKPAISNIFSFIVAPLLGLFLALCLWVLYPHSSPSLFITFGVLLFLCVSRINVYSTLIAGWASNSKYALLGSLRGVAQTISYEVRIRLILLSPLIIMGRLNINYMVVNSSIPIIIFMVPLFLV